MAVSGMTQRRDTIVQIRGTLWVDYDAVDHTLGIDSCQYSSLVVINREKLRAPRSSAPLAASGSVTVDDLGCAVAPDAAYCRVSRTRGAHSVQRVV